MPDKPNNQPVFPQLKVDFGFVITDPLKPGVTLLDYFAARAMKSMISYLYFTEYGEDGHFYRNDEIAKKSFDIAVAMLREREKRMQ